MTKQMQIQVRFFAILRDKAGCGQTAIHLADASRISDALACLSQMFPGLASMLCRVAYAVNESYMPATTVLHDGDELALIPPVSGG